MRGANAAVDDVRVHSVAAAVRGGVQPRDSVEWEERLVQPVEVPRDSVSGVEGLRGDGQVGLDDGVGQAPRERAYPAAGERVDDHAVDTQRASSEHAPADALNTARARHLLVPPEQRELGGEVQRVGGSSRVEVVGVRRERRAQVLRIRVVVVQGHDVPQTGVVLLAGILDTLRVRRPEEERGEDDGAETEPRHVFCLALSYVASLVRGRARRFDSRSRHEGTTASTVDVELATA